MIGLSVPSAERETKSSVVKKYGKVLACSRKISSIRLAIFHGACKWYQRRPARTNRIWFVWVVFRFRNRAMMVPVPETTFMKKDCGQRKGRPGDEATGSVPASGRVVPPPDAMVAT